MPNLENMPALARKYKGAPLACLWVLMTCHSRVSQSYLQSMTGYTDKTIASALQFLKEDGLIDHHSNGWMLADEVQLPLINSDENSPSRRISDPSISSSNLITLDQDLTTNTTTSRKNSDVWELLEQNGVYHNAITDDLAENVTPAQVRTAIRQLSLEGKDLPKHAGLLIHRLKHPKKIDIDHEADKRQRYSDWEK